ncbi:MAG: hypothetical protein F4081_06465 [Dehalococcoidia bacterium]|nr:hypothetical protein [Dehalococcoidia bacterium]
MWTLDVYRREGVAPRGMGKSRLQPARRLDGVYRGKGHWFADVVALLLDNQTDQRIAPRHTVQGFSQTHQIDVAWPVRDIDPLICAETKVTGGPPDRSHGARGALSDWSNRRRELKFTSTDLKLYRRGMDTRIEHWDVWRSSQTPRTYLLWAARLRPSDEIDRMVEEVQQLVNTYLDGAGVLGWREADDGRSYEIVPLPASARVSDLDDVLYRIATEIRRMAGPDNEPPPPVGRE